MGTRSATETIVGILLAFYEQSTWKQADLSQRLGIGTRALRQRLEELRDAGTIRFEREEEPPHVYWSVPKGWVPGGVLLTGDDAAQVLRLLARLPQSADRDKLLKRFTGHVGKAPAVNATPLRGNEQILHTVEEATSRRVPLRFDYFSTSRGAHRVRVASVHKVLGGDRWRFVATCHDRDRLSWFRVDNVLSATCDMVEVFRNIDEEELVRFQSTSIDGYAENAQPVSIWFTARYPEARWVRTNLPDEEQFVVKEVDGGITFSCATTAVELVARFVVGLGQAVTGCSPELHERVVALARQILVSLGDLMTSPDSR
jgi:predicted DNA-binding transcriptional regulator YafY